MSFFGHLWAIQVIYRKGPLHCSYFIFFREFKAKTGCSYCRFGVKAISLKVVEDAHIACSSCIQALNEPWMDALMSMCSRDRVFIHLL